jgi:hypothetical protein
VVHTEALGGSPHRASARDGKKVANVIASNPLVHDEEEVNVAVPLGAARQAIMSINVHYERRGFMIASFGLGDEGQHWRRHLRREFSPMEELMRDWSEEKHNIDNWQIPL